MTGSLPGRCRRTVLLATLLGLAGCAVGPDYAPPNLSLPARWGTAKAEKSRPPELAEWWKRLRDPALNALIAGAVAGNLDVATAKARVREARAAQRETVGALFPQVDGSASVIRAQDGGRVSSTGDLTVPGPYTSYQAGLDASWELDLFGANRRAVEAARYGLDAAEEDLRATLLTMIGDVATNYVEARGFQARIALARRTAASQRQTAALTRVKFEAGSVSAVDVANAEGLASDTEAAIPALEAAYAEAVHRLGVLTGQPPSALEPMLRRGAPIPAPPLPIPTGVPADLLLTRPDVRLAERQYAQSTALIGQAEAALYPDVSLTGDVATSGTRLGDLGKRSSISWSFGPTLSVPVFTGGQLKAAVDVQRAERDQSFLAYKAAVLTALEDVENAVVSLAQERIRSGKLASSSASYRRATTLARTLYEGGSSSFLDLLDAERSLYSAEDSLLQSRVAITTDYVALNKALGGGWNGLVDTAKPEIVDVKSGPRPISLKKAP